MGKKNSVAWFLHTVHRFFVVNRQGGLREPATRKKSVRYTLNVIVAVPRRGTSFASTHEIYLGNVNNLVIEVSARGETEAPYCLCLCAFCFLTSKYCGDVGKRRVAN